MMVFVIFHWPCATTLLTVRKETGSWKKTAAAAALPTAVGIVLCCMINLLF
jgi:ferrous iron transport protein B